MKKSPFRLVATGLCIVMLGMLCLSGEMYSQGAGETLSVPEDEAAPDSSSIEVVSAPESTSVEAVAAAGDLVVYQDALASPWQDNSWNAAITYASAERVYAGASAIKIVQNAWGGLSPHIGAWGAAVNVTPGAYSRFEFAAYGGTTGITLMVRMENDLGAAFPTVNYGLVAAYQWSIVSIPMSALNPNGQPIDRVNLLEFSGVAKTYFVDEIRFIGTAQSQAPAAPALASPLNGAPGLSASPALSWSASPNASSYRVQLSTSASFIPALVDQGGVTALSYSAPGLAAGSNYFWRVSASNAAGTSPFSATRSFTTAAAPPPAPPPVPATDLAVYQDGLASPWQDNSWNATITYASAERAYAGANSIKVAQNAWGGLSLHIGAWGAAANVDPAAYSQLQFAVYGAASGLSMYVRLENDLGASFPLVNFGAVPANQWAVVSMPMSQLNPNGQPIDRVNILEMSGALRTYFVDDLRFIGTIQAPAPAAPTLASPLNGAAGLSIAPTLAWNASSSATSYRLQLSTSASFAALVADQAGLTGLTWTSGGLLNSLTYYWRVSASNGSASSAWSPAASFATVGASFAPSVPILTSPLNAATGLGTNAALSWGAAAGASSYRVQVSSSAAFSTTLTDQSGITALTYSASGLAVASTYFWRVSATNLIGSSGFSAARSFTTAAAAPPPAAGKLFVTGYYPDFGTCSMPPAAVDYTAMTHIIYFHTDVSTTLAPYFLPVVSAAESTRIEWSNSNQGCARTGGESYQAELIRRAHAAGVKVLLCVGGIWGAGADRMALIAADSVKTQVWANSMTAYLIRKGFDGIDLDWEFPRSQADYMRMLRIVRRKFDAMPTRGIFVAAVYGDANSSAYDYPNLKNYLDQVNIMTYDMWNNQNTVWLNSPLGKAAGSPSSWRTWRASSALAWAAKGVPKSILANGIPFYSWKFSNATALGQPLSGYSYATYPDAVNALNAGGVYHWDDSAKSPYVTYSSGGVNYLITYDDTNSVKYKVQRTKDDGIGGIMIYELWSGWLSSMPAGKKDPLLQAVKRAVAGSSGPEAEARLVALTPESPIDAPSADPGLPTAFALDQNYPNPFNPSTTIRFQLPVAADVLIRIYDMTGREVATLAEGSMAAGVHSVVWDSRNADGLSVSSGMYIYRMSSVPADGAAGAPMTFSKKLMLLR